MGANVLLGVMYYHQNIQIQKNGLNKLNTKTKNRNKKLLPQKTKKNVQTKNQNIPKPKNKTKKPTNPPCHPSASAASGHRLCGFLQRRGSRLGAGAERQRPGSLHRVVHGGGSTVKSPVFGWWWYFLFFCFVFVCFLVGFLVFLCVFGVF